MNEISAHPAGEENPGFLLWQVSTRWSSSTAAVLKPFGLSHPQFVILATIDRLKNQEASQEAIARHIILDPKPTTHLLRSLQEIGVRPASLQVDAFFPEAYQLDVSNLHVCDISEEIDSANC